MSAVTFFMSKSHCTPNKECQSMTKKPSGNKTATKAVARRSASRLSKKPPYKQDPVRKSESRKQILREMHKTLTDQPIRPNFFYRQKFGPMFFGYAQARLYVAIDKGAIPPPIELSDTGRAKGWFGHVILSWQKWREVVRQKKAAGETAPAKWSEWCAQEKEEAARQQQMTDAV
jgi:hypothetical protein